MAIHHACIWSSITSNRAQGAYVLPVLGECVRVQVYLPGFTCWSKGQRDSTLFSDWSRGPTSLKEASGTLFILRSCGTTARFISLSLSLCLASAFPITSPYPTPHRWIFSSPCRPLILWLFYLHLPSCTFPSFLKVTFLFCKLLHKTLAWKHYFNFHRVNAF